MELVSLLNFKTSQNQMNSTHKSHLAIDGNTETCSITESQSEKYPWWRVELDRVHFVGELSLYLTSRATCMFLIAVKTCSTQIKCSILHCYYMQIQFSWTISKSTFQAMPKITRSTYVLLLGFHRTLYRVSCKSVLYITIWTCFIPIF